MHSNEDLEGTWRNHLPRLLELLYQADSPVMSQSHFIPYQRITGQHSSTLDNILIDRLNIHAQVLCHEIDPSCEHCQIRTFCQVWRDKRAAQKGNSIPFIDVFCGAGGLSHGLEKHGFVPDLAIDNDKHSAATFLFNRPFLTPKQMYTNDVNELVYSCQLPEVPLVVGGPPCQGFSNANKQGLANDPRNYLYKEFLAIVEKCRAVVCLLENVPGMLRYKQAIQMDFQRIGFEVRPFKLNTKEYGYPQNRERIFWFGLRTTNVFQFESAAATFQQILHPPVMSARLFTLADAIMDLPPLKAKTKKNVTNMENDDWGYTIAPERVFDSQYSIVINGDKLQHFLFNHRSKYNNYRDIEIYERLGPGETSDAESIQDIMPYRRRSSIFRDKFYKLRACEPAKTITAHMYYDCHMYIHPTQARGLTPREAARVQGFPDDYLFLGYPNEWYRQIGNAVSPLVANHLGYALAETVHRCGLIR